MREAEAAGTLDHPNICTIHEVGEDNGHNFIVMQYVEGETLSNRIHKKRFTPKEAICVALQIADALAEAHSRGITHRDIKPQNIMITARDQIKVLDFGLAKVVRDGQFSSKAGLTESLVTSPGMLVGTVPYMSPEQLRGEAVDGRSDIFSLGAVLYEMITGYAPFCGATPSEVTAAILRDEPPPLARYAPTVPPELDQIVRHTLRKDREKRYQTVKDLHDDLNYLRQKLELGAGPVGSRMVGTLRDDPSQMAFGVVQAQKPSDVPISRFRDTRALNTVRRGIAIASVTAVTIMAISGWLYFNRAAVLTEKDTILLADFENKTGDEVFDGTLKQGLATQLQQSPFFNLFPEARARQTLQLMGRSPNERITAMIAREICERAYLKALIAGSIAPLGSHYVITLEALNAQNGDSLAQEQAEAENKEDVLRALSRAATRLREKLGESLSSIQRFDKPLENATTSELEAFKAYALAAEQATSGRLMEAIPFLKRAVEIDPNFASAYNMLATFHGVTGRPGLAEEYAKKAYALRDRVSEYEKLRIANLYHGFVTGDVDKRIEVLWLQKRTYPRGWNGPIDLGYSYNQIGKSEQAIEEAEESIRLSPNIAAPYGNLALALSRVGRFAEAKNVLEQARQQKLDHPDFHYILYQIAGMDGDRSEMQKQIDGVSGKPEEYVAVDWQTRSAAFGGQWQKAQEYAGRAIDLTARGDKKEVAARYAAEQALRGAVFGVCREAREEAIRGLKLARGRASLPRVGLALALCGEVNQAKSLIDELIKLYPDDTVINSIWLPAIRSAVELQRGNAALAIEQLQAASGHEAAAEFWPQYLRANAYLKLGRSAEAMAEFQKILDRRGEAPLSVLYPLALVGVARAAGLAGDALKRRKAYEDFFADWRDADADSPVLIEAKREYYKDGHPLGR